MQHHILAEGLSKTYRIPVREPGLKAAAKSLLHPVYSDVRAVDNIGFSIDRGEIVGFIGPNGSGKTTTLKMLSGLLYPTSGSVTAAGFIPWQRKNEYLRKIGMLMGNRSQMPWNNTVYDTMIIFGEIYGISKDYFKKHLEELCAIFDAGKLQQKRVRNLSLGERSKCEFIIALLHSPEIVYLDEPTLGLDVTIQLRLRQYIKEYNKRYGATVILTSHYMSDITALCPRVMLINKGSLKYDGSLEGLTNSLTSFRVIKLTLEDGNPPIGPDSLFSQNIPAELMETSGNEYTFRVKKEDSVPVSLALMTKYSLFDFGISDPPIETIIDKMFTEEVLS